MVAAALRPPQGLIGMHEGEPLYVGTGNLLVNFDSARNSHTLKISRVFPNPPTPDCRVPHTFCKHVSGGDMSKFIAITGIQLEFT